MTKILLVDDSKFLRMAIERALARAGYVVLTASDGPKAIELVKSGKPDMLLPGMTGPDVLKALKKDSATAGIPVVAFTGLSQKNAVRLQKDGACAFLEKSALELDKGCDTLLSALAEILQKLQLEVPAGVGHHGIPGSYGPLPNVSRRGVPGFGKRTTLIRSSIFDAPPSESSG